MRRLYFAYASAAGITVLALGMMLVNPAHADVTFTNTSLKGTFGFAYDGNSSNLAVAGLGLLKADGNGGLIGTLSTDPSQPLQQVTGTYAVNGDGSGTMEIDYSTTAEDGTTIALAQHYDFVLTDGMKTLRAVRTDPGVTAAVIFAQQ
jgi:hypothetical protein